MNKPYRKLSGVALALAALTVGAAAQAQSTGMGTTTSGMSSGMSGSSWYAPAGGRYIGLNVGRSDFGGGCGIGAFNCDDTSDVYSIYSGGMWNKNFGLEFGATDFGDFDRGASTSSAYGFSIKAVGMVPLTPSFSAFAKVGTMYTRTRDTLGRDSDWGSTYGAGVSFDVTPQLAAVLEVDQTNMKFAGSREYINSTSLGLKYRF